VSQSLGTKSVKSMALMARFWWTLARTVHAPTVVRWRKKHVRSTVAKIRTITRRRCVTAWRGSWSLVHCVFLVWVAVGTTRVGCTWCILKKVCLCAVVINIFIE
jgi:hypothetical protein